MVKCEICGKSFKHINNTHLKKHGLTTKKYRVLFPHSEILSIETLKAKSDCMIGVNLGNIRDDARERMFADNPMKHKEVREKMSKTRKNRISSGDINALKNLGHLPTENESYIQGIFEKNEIPLVYVGDGKKWIAGRCPDFICEEMKIVLELDLDAFEHKEKRAELREGYLSEGYLLIVLSSIEEEKVLAWVKPFFVGPKWVKINGIKKGKTNGRQTVYNFHISPNNNYFADRFLVHNCFADYFRSSLYTSFFDNPKDIGLRFCSPDFFKEEIDKHMKFRGKETKREGVVKAISNELPVRLGIRFEDFHGVEKKKGVALELLKHLSNINYPVMINTKSDIFKYDEYLSALSGNKAGAAVHVTLISSNDKILKALEPGAPCYRDRLESMRAMSEAGVRVVARIEPFITFLNDDPEDVQRYMEDMKWAGVEFITFDTYSYSANGPGIRDSIENQGIDFDRFYEIMSECQWLGSLLLSKFMEMFREKGFKCSAFDFGGVSRNDDHICCCLDGFFDGAGFNPGNVLSAVRLITSRGKKPTTWDVFSKWVDDNGGWLSSKIYETVFRAWNMMEGTNTAYTPIWAAGIRFLGRDKDGQMIYSFDKNYDFRMENLEFFGGF